MRPDYTYAELLRMTKNRVIRIAGYNNIKHALRDGINKEVDSLGKAFTVNLSKKYLARLIASDK